MKKIFFVTVILFTTAFFFQSLKAQTEAQRVELCTKIAGGTTFLESYTVQLSGAKDGERAPIFRHAVALRKGNKYRFTICTDEESSDEAVLKLYDEAKLMGSSFIPETGKEYQNFDFDCNKSAIYIIFVSFKNSREGSSIAVISHVKTL
jgi:hypothetical protein